MTLPNFLVLGAQRAGTTQLHLLLEAHPQVYLPQRRKEIHFFDWYYDRGTEWYESFFPEANYANAYAAIGEVTPDYLSEPQVPARIASLLPSAKFLLSLRDPIARLISAYAHHQRSFNERRPFSRFVREDQRALERGMYARHLRRYLDLYPRERFLVLLFEEWIVSPEVSLGPVRRFLGLDQDWDRPEHLLSEKVNVSSVPKFRSAFRRAQAVGEWLMRHDIDWPNRLARRLGVARAFGSVPAAITPSEDDLAYLHDLYRPEVESLEALLGLDVSEKWRWLTAA